MERDLKKAKEPARTKMRKPTTVSIVTFFFLTSTASPDSSFGQSGIAPSNYDFGKSQPSEDDFLAKMRGYVGTQFWIRKPRDVTNPDKLFCDSDQPPPFQSYPLSCPRKSFGVKEAERFTIEDIMGSGVPGYGWLKVRFDSGKAAFLRGDEFAKNLYSEGKYSPGTYGIDFAAERSGLFFTEDPETVIQRLKTKWSDEKERKRQDEERHEKQRLARGGVKVGMTKKQVESSSWGKPDSVNSTIFEKKKMEQWVYGGGNYLYFENSRLQAIQTSQ